MTAGFFTKNESGSFQVDGTTPSFSLDRIINGNTGNHQYGHTYDQISVNEGELIALRSDYPVTVGYQEDGSARIICPSDDPPNGGGTSGVPYKAYIFSQGASNPSSGFGAQIFNGDGESIYYTGDKNLALVDVVEGHDDFYYDPSRDYAAIFCNQRVLITDQTQGAQPTVFRIIIGERSFVESINGGIRSRFLGYFGRSYDCDGPGGQCPQFFSMACDSELVRLLIVDVTNF